MTLYVDSFFISYILGQDRYKQIHTTSTPWTKVSIIKSYLVHVSSPSLVNLSSSNEHCEQCL